MQAASKLPQLNFTMVPNIIFDYWQKILSPGEFSILSLMCRKIYGFRNKNGLDKISLSQLSEGTNQARSTVIQHIKKLIGLGVVLRYKSKTLSGDDECNMFSLNIEEGGSTESEPQVVRNPNHGVVRNPNTQKKDYTKEKPTTEKEAAPAAAVFDCLKEIEIPQSEKEWLSEHYPESVLRHAVAYCTHKDTKIKTSLIQTLKWAAKTLPDIPIDMDVAVSENRKFAEQVAKEGTSLQEVVLEACLKYAEFKFPKSPCAVPICIEYDDKNFMTNFKAALKLYRFGKRILCS